MKMAIDSPDSALTSCLTDLRSNQKCCLGLLRCLRTCTQCRNAHIFIKSPVIHWSIFMPRFPKETPHILFSDSRMSVTWNNQNIPHQKYSVLVFQVVLRELRINKYNCLILNYIKDYTNA